MMKKGFTLIETVIYIAVVGLFLTAFTFFSLDIAGLEGKVNQSIEVAANASFLAQTFERLIKEATAITTPSPGALSSVLVLTHQQYGEIEISLINNQVVVIDNDGPWPLSAKQVLINDLVFSRSPGLSNKISFKFSLASLTPTAQPIVVESTVKNRY